MRGSVWNLLLALSFCWLGACYNNGLPLDKMPPSQFSLFLPVFPLSDRR